MSRYAAAPPRGLLIVEETHEFLSEERIDKTPVLVQQVVRLAKRGRKRWLGLTIAAGKRGGAGRPGWSSCPASFV